VPDSSILVVRENKIPNVKDFMKKLSNEIERYGEYAVFRNTKKTHRDSLKKKLIEYVVAFRTNFLPVIATNVISLLPKGSIYEVERSFKGQIKFRDKTTSGVYHYVVNNFQETLSIANAIAESGLVEWCHPDFVIEIKATTVDPLFSQQYYLNNTGQTGGVNNMDINAPEAWAISKGCYTTRVAVLDEGVEPHEDLGARYQTGFTALNPSGTGLPTSTQYHGQACAGIIAASHDNNLGMAGVAPNSLIIPVNGFSGTGNVSLIADGINAGWHPTRANADVLSNSWSWGTSTIDEIAFEINLARTQGRNFKGAVVVFSAGNGGGPVEFPGNVNGVITVGAISKSGDRWSYSATGSSLDLVAFSGGQSGDVVTLDLSDDPANSGDNRGNTNGNYISNFTGTSAAAPQVAGVAALMLSINPNLTEAQVRSILQQSANDMGSTGFDNQFGFGRLNAYEALRQSIGTINGSDLVCGTSQFTLSHQLQNVSGVTWQSSNPAALSIDSNTGVATRQNNFSGPITIRANITMPCGTISLPKDIWVGNPGASASTLIYPTGLRGTNPVSLSPGSYNQFNCDPVNGFPTSWNWTLPSGFSIFSGSTSPNPYIMASETLWKLHIVLQYQQFLRIQRYE
jgi:hypothetical protein